MRRITFLSVLIVSAAFKSKNKLAKLELKKTEIVHLLVISTFCMLISFCFHRIVFYKIRKQLINNNYMNCQKSLEFINQFNFSFVFFLKTSPNISAR